MFDMTGEEKLRTGYDRGRSLFDVTQEERSEFNATGRGKCELNEGGKSLRCDE